MGWSRLVKCTERASRCQEDSGRFCTRQQTFPGRESFLLRKVIDSDRKGCYRTPQNKWNDQKHFGGEQGTIGMNPS